VLVFHVADRFEDCIASYPKRRFGVRGLWYEEEEAMGKVFLTALCAPALLADHFREV
jgi:hypothetical protein